MEEYSKAVSEMYSQFIRREVGEMYSPIIRREVLPLGEYIGRLVYSFGGKSEVIGYKRNESADEPLLIVDASQNGGWTALGPFDVIFKDCERYWYVSVDDLAD